MFNRKLANAQLCRTLIEIGLLHQRLVNVVFTDGLVAMPRRFPQQFLHLLGSDVGIADFADIAAVHTRSKGLGTESHKGNSNQPKEHLRQAAVFFDDGKHKNKKEAW